MPELSGVIERNEAIRPAEWSGGSLFLFLQEMAFLAEIFFRRLGGRA